MPIPHLAKIKNLQMAAIKTREFAHVALGVPALEVVIHVQQVAYANAAQMMPAVTQEKLAVLESVSAEVPILVSVR